MYCWSSWIAPEEALALPRKGDTARYRARTGLVHARQGAMPRWAAAREADAAFEKCFELSPERKMMAHAAEHQSEGRLEEAEHLYRRVLRHNPEQRRCAAPAGAVVTACTSRSRGGRPAAKGGGPSRPTSSPRGWTSASCAATRTATPRRSSASIASIVARTGQRAGALPQGPGAGAGGFHARSHRSHTADASRFDPTTSARCWGSVTYSRPSASTSRRSTPTTPASGSARSSARPTGASRT